MEDQLVIIDGDVSRDEYRGGHKLIANDIMDMVELRQRTIKAIEVPFYAEQNDFVERLRIILQSHHGGRCPVQVAYQNAQAQATVILGDNWRVQPTDEFFHEVKQLAGDVYCR